MTSAWPSAEAAIHRWVRESSGLAATACYWPAKGKHKPEPPCCEMKLVGSRATGRSGVRKYQEAQPVEWLATLTVALGVHSLQLWTDSGSEPDVDAEVETLAAVDPDPDPTIEDARDALLEELVDLLPAGITATASGTDSISIVGDTASDLFSMGSSADIDLTLVAGPHSSIRFTRMVKVLMLDFRAVPTADISTATEIADAVRNAVGDYRNLIGRTGWDVGATVGDRPGYEPDATESRHVLEFELLGHVVDYAIPRPWVRRGPAVTATASGLSVSIATP
jgi:hypothetical protein